MIAILALTIGSIVRGQSTISVAPNVLVSRDGEVAHVESHIAANPRDPRNLLGTAITYTSPGIGTETKAYVSFDGGWTWLDTYFPDQRKQGVQGAFDPQAAFGVTGTAYLVALAYTENAEHDEIAFYRSGDGGLTWSKPVYLGSNYDRDTIAVDRSGGRFRGRIYVAAYDYGKANGVEGYKLFRSGDDGRNFQGPVPVGCTVNYMFTLTDGTLWIPCPTSTIKPSLVGSVVAMVSTDGGKTLKPITGQPINSVATHGPKLADITRFSGPVFCVDSSNRFRNRIYAVWLQGSEDYVVRVMAKHSDDRGHTWSKPRMVAPVSQNGATQYLPMAAVNRDGVLGVIWFEALPPENDTYDVFFAASLDGGDSFLAPRRVTSATSQPDHPENRAIKQMGGARKNALTLQSAYYRWKDAGDYTGLTADADGVFHAFWPDSRRGAFQLYTSRITVETTPNAAQSTRASDSERPIDKEVNVEFGPPIVPHDGSDEVIVARIRNVSANTIWGPLVVTVSLSGPGRKPANAPDATTIFDPPSGQWSQHAQIDYTPALRDIPFLAPGAATEAVEWHFRNASGGQLNLMTHVYAGRRP